MLVLATTDLHGLLATADLAAAMSVEALLGTDAAFAADLIAMRPHPGQAVSAARMRALLIGSQIMISHRDPATDTRVQDAYSLRCAPQVRARGLGLRVHGNQLGPGPGVRLAVEHRAASVDHCTCLSSSDVDALAASSTVATLLPACDLCCRAPLPDARALLDAGVTVALATNCNPGSSYTTSMAFCVATAVLQRGMSVPAAVRAATVGGARALRRADVGALRPGARADVHTAPVCR